MSDINLKLGDEGDINLTVGDSGDINLTIAGSGINEFLELTDVDPTTYSGQSGKVVSVNSGEDALEFTTSGSGDVSGPGSAVNENLTVFDSTTGKLIKDSGTNLSAVTANTAKNTNVSTNLSEGTSTQTTVDVNSSDGTNATLVSASATRAGLLTKPKFDEIVVNTTHKGLTNDPHSVTASQVGLGSVSNVATDDTAYNATSWNTNLDSATKNAIRDKVETMDTAIGLNTSKVTNVSTDLSEGTSTETTVDVNSSDGTNATLVSASATRAGVLTKPKFDEIVANTSKATNVSTNLSLGTGNATTEIIESSDGTNVTLIEADTNNAGLLGADKWDEIVANTVHSAGDGSDHTNVASNTLKTAMLTREITTDGGKIELLEGTNNGTSKVIFQSPAALGADRTITIPDANVDLGDIATNTSASHAEAHTILSHSDTTATGAELNTLTGGGDTTLHDHDGISENTTHRSSNGSDHSIVGTNTTAIGLNTTHRGSDGSDHSDVVTNTAKVSFSKTNVKATINHGATSGTTRPTGFDSVEWIGTVEPTNATNDDTWIDVT